MATEGDERAPCESDGGGKKSRKRPYRPEINEELQNVSQEAERNELKNSSGVPDEGGNCSSMSVTVGKSDLEQILKQMTFTRPEIQHLTALLHSRMCDDATGLPITQQQPTTIENLSSDLLSNIFIRLLAKQLARMRSVSKSWDAILSQSSFIKSHLHRSIHNNNRVLLVFYYNLLFPHFKPFTAHSCQSLHLELTNFIKLPPLNPKSGHRLRVIGSVHGLICSCHGGDVIHIWNPSLAAVSAVPPHSNSIPSGGWCFFQFGYDPKTDDYKIVKLIGRTGTSPLFVQEWLQVEVYSMRKGSWKFITQKLPSHVTMITDHDGVCVDGHGGHLHWPGFTSETIDFDTIVAFDLGSETFREIPLPDSLLDGQRRNKIGILGGKPCVVSRGAVYEVWVINEYGVSDSWVKHHVVLPSFDNEYFFGFTSRDEFLSKDYDHRLVLYNPSKIVGTFGSGETTADKVVEYVDSLVWVEPAMP